MTTSYPSPLQTEWVTLQQDHERHERCAVGIKIAAVALTAGAALFGYSHLYGGMPGGQAPWARAPTAGSRASIVPSNRARAIEAAFRDAGLEVLPTRRFGCSAVKRAFSASRLTGSNSRAPRSSAAA